MQRSATRKVLTAWPYALGLCVLLTATRFAACHRDAKPYGNAWTEDHSGYCSNSGWDALTGGSAPRALALIAITAAWPATALVAATVAASARHDGRLPRRVWPWVAGIGSALVIAFRLKWGHVSIVGGAGG
ncbi:MAG TPA: hypothetical protein VI300_30600 [Solirubrobacter sp.]